MPQQTVKQYLDDVKQTIDTIEKDLLDPATGNFKTTVSVGDILAAAPDLEADLKAFGVQVPATADEAIAAASTLLKIFGK